MVTKEIGISLSLSNDWEEESIDSLLALLASVKCVYEGNDEII